MKENKYDNEDFFERYSQMGRSMHGLQSAGEWHALRAAMPDMSSKRMLDLGCGYGWHCKYAIENGAERVVGIDLSTKMIRKAVEINSDPKIEYHVMAVEDFDYPTRSFDVVLSSLTFHYIERFEDVCRNINRTLVEGGDFIFSIEHPIFTAYGTQEWYRDDNGEILHWPVDKYFDEGIRKTNFLGEEVMKCHKTLTNYLTTLIECGFEIVNFIEPQPSPELMDEMRDELRRPMMLIIAVRKRREL